MARNSLLKRISASVKAQVANIKNEQLHSEQQLQQQGEGQQPKVQMRPIN